MKTWGFPRYAMRALFVALTGLVLASAALAADDFLDPEQAFRLSARSVDATHVEVRFDIEPGYYLYRERLNAEIAPDSVKMAELQVPKGKVKFDETFQKDVEYYRDSVTFVVPLQQAPTTPYKLSVGNQGCADKGAIRRRSGRSRSNPGKGRAVARASPC